MQTLFLYCWSRRTAAGLGVALLCACTGDAAVSMTEPEDAVSAAPALATPEYRELAAADWELASGAENYICIRQVLPESIYVGGWNVIAPNGTHHVLVTQSADPDGFADGASECDSATLGTQTLFAAGVGSMGRRMPAGIAMKLEQGSQLLLSLHLFNQTDRPLRGRSGAAALRIEEKDVSVLADMLTAGPVKLEIPPGRSTSHGSCTFKRDTTIFGIGPHMHQMGVAMQVLAHTVNYGDLMLFDGPFSFDNQQGYPLEMLEFKAGDTVDVACTYDNTSDRTLHFGTSSNDEMCSAGLARFPAGGPSQCVK